MVDELSAAIFVVGQVRGLWTRDSSITDSLWQLATREHIFDKIQESERDWIMWGHYDDLICKFTVFQIYNVTAAQYLQPDDRYLLCELLEMDYGMESIL